MATTFDLLMAVVKESGQKVEAKPQTIAELMAEPPVEPDKPYKALQKTGRRSNGNHRDHGNVVHAVEQGAWDAMCGAHPEGSSDWSCTESNAVTCGKCLRKIAAMNPQDLIEKN